MLKSVGLGKGVFTAKTLRLHEPRGQPNPLCEPWRLCAPAVNTLTPTPSQTHTVLIYH
jgi:hypothetical protein